MQLQKSKQTQVIQSHLLIKKYPLRVCARVCVCVCVYVCVCVAQFRS